MSLWNALIFLLFKVKAIYAQIMVSCGRNGYLDQGQVRVFRTPPLLLPLTVSLLPSLSIPSLGIEGLDLLGQWALEVLATEI